jgi:C-terminal processing protease CtpA/Prc
LVGKSSKFKVHQSKVTTNSHVQEDFCFAVKKKDYSKRIIVSVHNAKTEQIVGCTAFNVQNIMKKSKDVNGWYYLLNEELGQLKHMRVDEGLAAEVASDLYNTNMGYVSDSESSGYSSCSDDERDTSDDAEKLEPVEIRLKKDITQSYGLSLEGHYQVKVSNVKAGSPAEHAGIEVGDIITHVDGLCVEGMCAEDVGRIFKYYPEHIVICILTKFMDNDSGIE